MPRRKRQPTAISYQVTPGSQWWAYARHSPGPEQSIGSQRQAIAEFAAAHGITITRWFVDEAEGGSSMDRDQFTAMVEAAGILSPEPRRPAASGILVLNFARFGRDQQMTQFFISGFRLRGWQVVPIHERESLPEGNFASIFEALTHWKDQQRLEEITKETKRGIRRVVTQQITLPDGRIVTGFSGGGFPPVGYRAEKVQTGTRKDGSPRYNSYWVADEEPDQWGETPWTRVTRAWAMMASGRYSYREIEDSCHLFKALNSSNDFFRRRTYLGVRVCGDLEIPNAHPAAVSAEAFARVQELLDNRLRPIIASEHIHPVHLLAGLLSCGYCGGTIVADTKQGRYVCRTLRLKGRAGCPHSMRTPIAVIETAVVDALGRQILTGGGMAGLLEQVNAQLWEEASGLGEEIEREERKLARLEETIGKLLDALEAGGGTAIRTRLANREREIELIRARLARLRERHAASRPEPLTPAELIPVLEDLREVFEAGTPDERRRVLQLILAEVRVFNDQLEIRYRLPIPTNKGFRLSTPSWTSFELGA